MGIGHKRRRQSVGLQFEQLEPRHVMTGVVINEFLAVNSNGILDQDGERTDWIELRNTSAAPVDLAGWHLTDDAADLDKWTLPSVTLQVGGFLTIFASGKDRAVAGQQLHTNFMLAQEGEYLALVMPGGVMVVDAFAPYPAQLEDISYGRGVGSSNAEPLVDENEPVRARVPTSVNDVPGLTWTQTAYDDSAWAPGTSGVGYERTPGSVPDYNSYFEMDVNALMPATPTPRDTIYLRIPFNVANISEFQSLTLQMRYDDGYVAYLNGQVIASRNAPASPAWNSSASGSRPDNVAIVYESIPIDQHLGKLVEGGNVLAIHGLNQVNNRSDFLIGPLLTAQRAGDGPISYMGTPTPGAANVVGTMGFVADTKFSADRGFYNSPFTVQITTATAGAQIRYTLDGSAPTELTGTVYNPASPPLITKTTVLRAAAYKTGFTPSNVDTQTYIFLDNVLQQNGAGLPAHANWGYAGPDWAVDSAVVNNPLYAGTIKDDLQAVPTVSLVLPWNQWFGTGGQGIYISGTNIERGGSVEFFTADGSEEFQIDSALEIQGGSSTDRWKMDKLSVRATFKAPFGPTELDANLFHDPFLDQGGAAAQFDTLIFDAQSNYTWAYGGTSAATDQRGRAKIIQDQVVSDIQNLAGGQAPHGRVVHLYLNGLYWGMYIMHERPDEAFAASYLGGDKDDYDVVKHNPSDIVAGDLTAFANYDDMLNLTRQSMTVPANYAAAAAKIDVDDLITYMIVNYYVGNDDWAHHNWYATYNRVDPNGKWRFHSWDAEHVFKSLNYNAIRTGGLIGSPEEVHLNLMANDEHRLRFSDLVQKHFFNGGAMTPQNAAAIYEARAQQADRAIVGESARWGDSHTTSSEAPGAGGAYTREHWIATKNDLMANYFPNRTNVVRGQFNVQSWLVPLGAPQLNQYGGTFAPGFALTLTKPAGSPAAGILYYTLDGSDPRAAGGGLSPTALVYSGAPISLTTGTVVRTRIHDAAQAGTRNDWSPEIAATFLPETPFPLRITELHYNPAEQAGVADPATLEFIELTNTGSQPISLNGVQITQFSSEPYVFANGQTLGPGQRIIVARNPSNFQAAYGPGLNVAAAGYANANLSNGGERLVLVGPLGEVLQDFVYGTDGAWPAAAAGNGKSLEIINPLGDPTSPSNWRSSFYRGGSPGANGQAPALTGDFDVDGDVDGADFLLWQRGLGTPALTGTVGHGDADGDRDVDGLDLGLWKQNFGARPAIVAAATATAPAVAAAAVLADDEWILADAPANAAVGAEGRRAAWHDEALAVFAAGTRIELLTENVPTARPGYRPPARASLAPTASVDAADDELIEALATLPRLL